MSDERTTERSEKTTKKPTRGIGAERLISVFKECLRGYYLILLVSALCIALMVIIMLLM